MERFASAMREARARKKMSQKELSEKTGIATSTISSYESGGKVPPLDIAIKIAKALGFSIDELADLDESTTSSHSAFGEVINGAQRIIDSDIGNPVVFPIGRDLKMEFTIRLDTQMTPDPYDEWLAQFAKKWQLILNSIKEDPLFREIYKPWLINQIDEARNKGITCIGEIDPFDSSFNPDNE